MFSPVNVRGILQIPLHVEALEYFVAWHYTKSGTFSARLAYHLEFDHQFGRHYANSNSPGSTQLSGVWKELWHLHLPGKIKHFGWKVLKGVLPCYGVLAGRHIPLILQCPICKVGLEDIQHCLFTCDRATQVWSLLGLTEEIDRAVVQDRSGSITLDILIRLHMTTHDIPTAELILVAMWFIWWQRRQVVKGETVPTPEQSAISIQVLATNFVRVNTPNQPIRKNDQV